MTTTVTNSAAAAIRNMAARRDPPCGAQLRIAKDDDAGQLNARMVAGPHDGDHIVHGQGVRVYLDPAAVEIMAGKTLDVHAGTDGSLTFTVEDNIG
jgi:Fe-S cluster assembly iron-binding protein IscA